MGLGSSSKTYYVLFLKKKHNKYFLTIIKGHLTYAICISYVTKLLMTLYNGYKKGSIVHIKKTV